MKEVIKSLRECKEQIEVIKANNRIDELIKGIKELVAEIYSSCRADQLRSKEVKESQKLIEYLNRGEHEYRIAVKYSSLLRKIKRQCSVLTDLRNCSDIELKKFNTTLSDSEVNELIDEGFITLLKNNSLPKIESGIRLGVLVLTSGKEYLFSYNNDKFSIKER